jgi:murein DD-endopeptidase MepM/ murein hydrolase activator NlpD
MRFLTILVLIPLGTMWGASVRDSALGSAASETSCSLTRTANEFDPSTRQVFLRLTLQSVRSSDRLRVDWLDPRGQVAASAPFEELPAASSLCLLSQLPVGGFAPASQPGTWTVRVFLNGTAVHERPFRILPSAAGGLRIAALNREDLPDHRVRLTLETAGAHSETTVNLAQYTESGGWQYLAHLLPEGMDGGRIVVNVPPLPPAEYVVILRNPEGVQSAPARFLISTDSGYRFPAVQGQPWVVTQRPYGSFSHWGRTVHAWDLAPGSSGSRDARYVTAMRPGVVRAFDLGLGQTPHQRIFGNYITLVHDDGEFSHYAHLRAGSFLVRTGQRVEQGQPLAEVGTSGYSFGVHLHVQVTKSSSISSPSIPFRFEDLAGGSKSSSRGPILSSGGRRAPGAAVKADRQTGVLTLAEWWTSLLSVPSNSRALQIRLGWDDGSTDFDLYVVSPSGRHFSSSGARPEVVRVDDPEPGTWRMSVQAVQGSGTALPFWVDHDIEAPQKSPASQGLRSFR